MRYILTRTDIELAMHRLNHRPRKCLHFKTPHEVFTKQLVPPHRSRRHAIQGRWVRTEYWAARSIEKGE